MPYTYKRVQVPQALIDCIVSCIKTDKDCRALLYDSKYTFSLVRELNLVILQAMGLSVSSYFLRQRGVITAEGPAEHAKAESRIVVFTDKITFDLLTGILLSDGYEGFWCNAFDSDSKPTLCPLCEEETIFDKYFTRHLEKWKKLSEHLKVCGDVAEDLGDMEVSRFINKLADRRQMEKVLSLLESSFLGDI